MKQIRPLLCVCIMSAMLMAALALSPGLNELITAYGVSESVASLSITLPYLMSIPFTLLTGKLTARFSKKALSLVGAAIICVTGLVPYLLQNFTLILVVRTCMGIGLGLLFTLAPSIAPDYYTEGQMRSLTIGMQSAWAGSGGFVFNILSGHLVQTEARRIFLVYGLCIVFFLLILALLPYQPPKREEQGGRSSAFNPGSLFIASLTFLFLVANMTLSLSISVHLAESGIGGPIESGYATSAFSAAAFLIGCLYLFVSKLLKTHAVFAACALSALGMILCVISGSLTVIYVGSALSGAGLSIFMPSCVNRIIKTTPPSAASMSIAVMMVGSSVGQTFSGIFINPIARIFGEQTAYRFYIAAVIFAIIALMSFIQDKKGGKTR